MCKLISLFFLLLSVSSYAGQLNGSLFSQSLYLGKASNLITQNVLRGIWSWENKNYGQTYGGVYFDNDLKSNGDITYTDKQFSPLIGHEYSYIFGYPVTVFTELRQVNRIGDFPDNRAQSTADWRTGALTYDFTDFTSQFLEHYGAFFYTTLYGHDVIFQGWLRHGKRFTLGPESLKAEVLHELNVDLNDFVQPNNTYLDYKPGARIGFFKPGFQLSLLQQYSISVFERKGNRSPEWRTLLVYAQYF